LAMPAAFLFSCAWPLPAARAPTPTPDAIPAGGSKALQWVRSDKWGCGLRAGAAPIPHMFFTEQRGSARRSPRLATAYPAACTQAGPAAGQIPYRRFLAEFTPAG
jgi:hypothetical protein